MSTSLYHARSSYRIKGAKIQYRSETRWTFSTFLDSMNTVGCLYSTTSWPEQERDARTGIFGNKACVENTCRQLCIE